MSKNFSTKSIVLSFTLEDVSVAQTTLAQLEITPDTQQLSIPQIKLLHRNSSYKGVTEDGRFWFIFVLPAGAARIPALRQHFVSRAYPRPELCLFAMEYDGDYPLGSNRPLRTEQYAVVFRAGGLNLSPADEYAVLYDGFEGLRFENVGTTAKNQWLPPTPGWVEGEQKPDPFHGLFACGLFRCLIALKDYNTLNGGFQTNEQLYEEAHKWFRTIWDEALETAIQSHAGITL